MEDIQLPIRLLPISELKLIADSARKRMLRNQSEIELCDRRISKDMTLVEAIDRYFRNPCDSGAPSDYDRTWTYMEKIKYVLSNSNKLGVDYFRTIAQIRDVIYRLDGVVKSDCTTIYTMIHVMTNAFHTVEKADCPVNGKYYRITT